MIPTSDSRLIFSGNGTTTEFPYHFPILKAADMKVMTVSSDGTETVLTEDYYVDITGQKVLYPGYAPGDERTEDPPVEPLPEGWKLVIWREMEATQETDLGDKFPFNLIEAGLDKLTMLIQNLGDVSRRSIHISEGSSGVDTTLPVAGGKSFRWNAAGTALEGTEDPGVVIDKAKEYEKEFTALRDETAANAAQASRDVQETLELAKTEGLVFHNSNVNAHSDFVGCTDTKAGVRGFVPAPAAGNANKVLFSGGMWRLLFDVVYPIGILIAFAVDTDPNMVFPGTTWERRMQGRVAIGVGTYVENGVTYTYALGTTGGEAKHSLSAAEGPKHTHDATASTGSAGAHTHPVSDQYISFKTNFEQEGSFGGLQKDLISNTRTVTSGSNGAHTHPVSVTVNSAGNGTAHENRMPYEVVAWWERKA